MLLNENKELTAKVLNLEVNLEGNGKQIVTLQKIADLECKCKEKNEKNDKLVLELKKGEHVFEVLSKALERQLKTTKQ